MLNSNQELSVNSKQKQCSTFIWLKLAELWPFKRQIFTLQYMQCKSGSHAYFAYLQWLAWFGFSRISNIRDTDKQYINVHCKLDLGREAWFFFLFTLVCMFAVRDISRSFLTAEPEGLTLNIKCKSSFWYQKLNMPTWTKHWHVFESSCVWPTYSCWSGNLWWCSLWGRFRMWGNRLYWPGLLGCQLLQTYLPLVKHFLYIF